MQAKHFPHLIPHREDRVQRRHGLLKNHGNPVASDFAHIGFRKLEKILAVEENATVHDFPGRVRNQLDDGMRRNAFAAAGLTHQPQRLAGLNGKADIIHRFGDTVSDVEIGFKVFNAQ